MIEFLKKLENFNEPKHSGLWGLTQVLMVYMDVPQVQLPSPWSKEKINIYYIFCTFITKGMDHLDKSISNTAMFVWNKSKTWFRDIF